MNADKMLADLAKFVDNLEKEIKVVNGKTAKRGKSIIAKEVVQTVRIPQKNIRRYIKSSQIGKRSAAVDLENTPRIPLRDFGARQTKAGVTYQISRSGGRKTAKGGFVGPKPGLTFAKTRGRVFARTGKSRLPIVQLFGVSAWGVVRYRKKSQRIINKNIRAELLKQIKERLRYRKLKAEGAI